MDYDVFISHSSANEQQVKPLCEYLEDKGLKCFVSYRDIPTGVSYPGAITRALRESKMLLLVLSKESNESTQVDRELTLANDQKMKMSCFRLEDIAYSDDKAYLMSGVNWLDAFPAPEQYYFALLQDICRQLGREVPKKEETKEAGRARNMKRDVFISYSRMDLDLVKQIKEEIERKVGIECWMDINGIESGSSRFTRDIVEGIDNCRFFLFMLSEHSQKSKYALRELNYAYDESEIHEKKIVILNTNLEFTRWVNVLYDEQMTAALIGRLMHHCHLILFPGENNRLRESSINDLFQSKKGGRKNAKK